LADVIGRGDLADLGPSERLARRRELDEAVAAWTARRGETEAQEELQRCGVPAHAVQNGPECLVDPQLQALGHFWPTEHADFGEVRLEGPRCFLSATPGRVGDPPTLGQHLFPVLQDILGYDEDRVADLLVSGALE
jgi:crotonobetainyl-CoA:carnitine CoA-transferase CaiB-like acyl-CoA transferase